MKNTYSNSKIILSPEEEKELLLNATIVFDTNILLNFYKYSSKTCKDACDTIEKIKERLFLPYQVGLEYYNNRERIIKEQRELAHYLKKEIDTCFDRLNLIEQSDFYSIIHDHRKKLKEEIDEKNKERPQFEPDNIKQFWEKVYKGRVSAEPSIQKRIDLCGTIQKRYELDIPPGFKDDSKKHNLYGDAFIWLDVLEYAKKEKKDIIFVSEDIKSDWIKEGALKVELIKEFQSETGQKIKHYTFETFLKKIAKEQKIVLPKSTREEIEKMAKTFQNLQNAYKKLESLGINDSMKHLSEALSNTFKPLEMVELQNNLIKAISINPIISPSLFQPKPLIDPQPLIKPINLFDEIKRK